MAYLGVINKRLTNNTMIMSDETNTPSEDHSDSTAAAPADVIVAPVVEEAPAPDPAPVAKPAGPPSSEEVVNHVALGESALAKVHDFASFELKEAGEVIAKLTAFIKKHL